MQGLYDEYNILNNQYADLIIKINNSWHVNREIDNYNRIVKFMKNNVQNKMDNIKVNNIGNRFKRGILNGLGTIVKYISGNMDSSDNERISKILNHLKSNEKRLQEQLKIQYSVSHSLIKNFNNTVQSIKHNELILKSKILQLAVLVNQTMNREDMLFAKDIFQQLLTLYSSILNTLQDIENSVTFCKLGVMHPSIIRPVDLFQELLKISEEYKNQFPFEIKFENIFDIESVIKIHCQISNNQIIYFLSIPIDFEDDFNLYHLIPIPTKRESEFVTTIPNSKFILKSKNSQFVKSLRGICAQSKIYHCSNELLTNQNTSCEEQILLNEEPKSCKLTSLTIGENHLEIIPEINTYLAVFPTNENLEIQCKNQVETKTLSGIFLIKPSNDCELKYKMKTLQFQTSSSGQPLLMDPLHFTSISSRRPAFKINLETLNFKQIPLQPMLPIIDEDPLENAFSPSLWTVVLYVTLIIVAMYIAYVKFKKIRRQKITTPKEPQQEDMELQGTRISLPGGASF